MDLSRKLAEVEDDAAADAVSKVLGDDDLLAEILLCVGFPTTLVRAAAACKRWLHHASDKAFLRRFRKLNPPRLLGFYIKIYQGAPRFVPMLPPPQLPGLAAAGRIVGGYVFLPGADGVMSEGYNIGVDGESLFHYEVSVHGCRNGSVSTVLCGRRRHGFRYESRVSVGMHSPLCPERAMAIDPPLSPHHQHPEYDGPHGHLILSREDKDGGLSYFYVMLENPMELDTASATNFTAHVFILKDGVWCMVASATTRIDHWRGDIPAVLVDNKIYMVPTYTEITVLDLATSSFSTIQLPLPRVLSDFMISRADDASSVYLVRMKEDQLRIWLHKGGSWSVVDTFSLNEMCANLMMSGWVKDTVPSEHRITHLGDNAEFVLLQRRRDVLYLDTRHRTLRRLYEVPEEDEPRGGVISVKPFMMIWPPTFPALKSYPTRFAFWPSDNLYIALVEVT